MTIERVSDQLSEADLARVAGGLASPTTKDSMAEMGEEQQLTLQSTMDQMTKAASQTSNLLKKQSSTTSTIISNLK